MTEGQFQNKLIVPQVRARCPMCGEPMIYTLLIVGDLNVWAWLCNCRRQPDHMLADIANARLEALTTLAYTMEVKEGNDNARN